MIKALTLSLSALLCVSAFAQEATCNAAAAEKKLAGAAKNSFLKKCERVATEKCTLSAQEKKLAGAAKNSNVKKCVKEAVGA
jgi:uncharacterized protein (UPF0335 family)